MNYNKLDLIRECMAEYYMTYRMSLDTRNFVPQEFNMKLLSAVFKDEKKAFKEIASFDKKYQKLLGLKVKMSLYPVNKRKYKKLNKKFNRLSKKYYLVYDRYFKEENK